MDSTVLRQLHSLRRASLKVARADTSCFPERYQKLQEEGSLISRLTGHCGPIAFMVKAVAGGSIVTGVIQGEPHFWNRLETGEEVDLTSCQFGGDGISALKTGVKVNTDEALVPLQFLYFANLVRLELDHP